MKRHPALETLSDDHHRALVLAREVRRSGEGAPGIAPASELWPAVRGRFQAELEPHFRAEEEVLLPALEAAGERALAERTRGDHARLRALAAAEPSAARAIALGTLLHDHVRFEERVLFPRAEALLASERLETVGVEISSRLRRRDASGASRV